MKKFEYKIIVGSEGLGFHKKGGLYKESGFDDEFDLNEEGNKGWELVAVDNRKFSAIDGMAAGKRAIYWLKREIKK